MKKSLIAALILCSAAVLGAGDNLWTKAVDLAKQFKDRVPGKMVLISEMLDGDGHAKETEEIWFTLMQKADGTIDQVLIRYLKNGRDITKEKQAEEKQAEEKRAEEKRKAEHGKRKADGDKKESVSIGFESAGVFHPDLQKDTQVTETVQRKAVDGKICLGYSFRQKSGNKEEGMLVGTAWLEKETGAPLEVQYTNEPLPKHVKELTTTVRYVLLPDGTWEGREMRMEGMGGILFIKKRFRMTMRFEDFFPYAEPEKK